MPVFKGLPKVQRPVFGKSTQFDGNAQFLGDLQSEELVQISCDYLHFVLLVVH